MCILHNLTRLDKFVARSQFENQRNFFLERKSGQRVPVILFILDDAVDVGIFFHDLNLCSLAVHFSVKLCRFKTALSERRLYRTRLQNRLI